MVRFFGLDTPSNDEARDAWLTAFGLLSILSAFIVGNLFLLDSQALFYSASLAVVCTLILLSIFLFWRISGGFAPAVLIVFCYTLACIRLGWHLGLYAFVATGLWGGIILIRKTKAGTTYASRLVLLGIAFAITKLGTWSYAGFDILRLSYAGLVAKDTLYHASIAAMLKQYGVPSTGLNGLIETPYYVLSHTVIAAASALSNVPVLTAYGVVPTLLFAPSLIISIVQAIPSARSIKDVSIATFLTMAILFLLPIFLSDWAVWGRYYFSESYLLALVFFCAGLSLLAKDKTSVLDEVVIIGIGVMATQSKASVGLMFLGLVLTRFIFLSKPHSRIRFGTTTLLLSAATYVLVSSAAGVSSESVTLSFLSFPRQFGGAGPAIGSFIELRDNGTAAEAIHAAILVGFTILTFVLMHFIVPWTYLGLSALKTGFRAFFTTPPLLYTLAATGAGLVFALALDIFGSANSYFTNVAMFTALPPLIGLLVHKASEQPDRSTRVTFCVALLIFAGLAANTLLANSIVKRKFQLSENYHSALVEELVRIREKDDPRTMYEFSTDSVLRGENPMKDCTVAPFLMPAISEHAWLRLIGSDTECTYANYSYEGYFSGPIGAPAMNTVVSPRIPGDTEIVFVR